MIRIKDITDGTGKTYAVGEKFLQTDLYGTGYDAADNEWMFVGYDNDMYRMLSRILIQIPRHRTLCKMPARRK